VVMLSATEGAGNPSQTASFSPPCTARASRTSTSPTRQTRPNQASGVQNGITGRAATAIAAAVPMRMGTLRLEATNRREAAAISARAASPAGSGRVSSVMRLPQKTQGKRGGATIELAASATVGGGRGRLPQPLDRRQPPAAVQQL